MEVVGVVHFWLWVEKVEKWTLASSLGVQMHYEILYMYNVWSLT